MIRLSSGEPVEKESCLANPASNREHQELAEEYGWPGFFFFALMIISYNL